ncbi:CaiB/BaiF CoA transferase family protein [Peristeroidobacter soli]|uniref:CaiB/BaiF CoA transferase family protein n=1 Tax=Peristeroidobacter soli TaxID=2497877 RepID=UPI00101DA8BD|nr:CaiB/BaiF CoA-transferase family protein [Peristeroidobacter soli]
MNTAGPLSHIRVLDLSRIMAGPWASQILADLGADVIKVERPGAGDDTRAWGPPFLKDEDGKATANSGYFLCVNRGKRSITLNLDTPEGQDIVRALAARSDVLLENYKVGTLQKFNLGPERLREINPRLIYASVTGFGQTGPRSHQAAYDFMIQALGGLMSVTGERDDRPGGGPQKVGVPIVDLMTGMYTTVGILAALARREQTGRGDYIDIAMLDVQAAFLANQSMNYLLSGKPPKRAGNSHPNIQPQDVFACRDGHIALAVGNDGQFVKFCEAIAQPQLAIDVRFAKNADRVRNVAELTDIVSTALRADTMQAWDAKLSVAGVPCAPINTVPGVFNDPQIIHRRMLQQVPHPLSGTVPQVISPLRFTEAPLRFDRAPPLLGQHTADVLNELGIAAGEQSDLQRRGVI